MIDSYDMQGFFSMFKDIQCVYIASHRIANKSFLKKEGGKLIRPPHEKAFLSRGARVQKCQK